MALTVVSNITDGLAGKLPPYWQIGSLGTLTTGCWAITADIRDFRIGERKGPVPVLMMFGAWR